MGLLVCVLAACLTGCSGGAGVAAPEPTRVQGSYPAEVGYPPTPPHATSLPDKRLVPDEVPRSMLLCRYEQVPAPTFPPPSGYVPVFRLSGSRSIEGLGQAAGDLQVPPMVQGETHACTLVGGTPFPFLARIEYDARTVWLATSTDINSCADITNGSTTSHSYLGGDFQASYDAGTWTRYRRRGTAPACYDAAGRFGQHRQLVPDEPVRIRMCKDQVELQPVTDPDRIARVLQLLNKPKTTASRSGCEGTVTHQRQLLFEYRSGRSVAVDVLQGCRPDVFSSSLSEQLTDPDVQTLFTAVAG